MVFLLNFAKYISIWLAPMSALKAHIISRLQKDILLLQGFKPLHAEVNDAGLHIIRQAFPNSSFPLGAIHEFFCNDAKTSSASCGFIAGILSFLMKTGAPSVWVSATENIYPPALKHFGIDPAKIIFISSKKEKEIFWIVEEALKCEALSAVIGELNDISFTESRRLQLAVEQSKVTGFVLRNNPKNFSTACVTKWKVQPTQKEKDMNLPGVGFPRWNVELVKVRNGKPGSWQMEWRGGRFKLVTQKELDIPGFQRKAV